MAKSKSFKIRRQKPIKGGREKIGACVEAKIQAKVEATAARFKCSKSFVQSVALAEFFGIEHEAL